MIYVVSDLHLAHNKEFVYKARGFNSIAEHDEKIIENYNSIVKDDDTVYILGDCALGGVLGLGRAVKQLSRLGGKKYLVIGNHDTDNRIAAYRKAHIFEDIQFGYRLQYKHISFYLSHYPTLVGSFGEKLKLVNLCGHSHTKDPLTDSNKGAIYHCELDAHDNKPVSLDFIVANLKYCFS